MTPITMVEGARKLDAVSERNLAERRFSALAAAVREHEASVRRREYAMRPQDQSLYRRLRQICGDVVTLPAVAVGAQARAARVVADAEPATGSARTDTVSATLRETDVLPVLGAEHDLVGAGRFQGSVEPGVEPGLLQVVQDLLGLVLEPQHVDASRPTRRPRAGRPPRARPRRAGARAGRSWRRRSRPASAPPARGTWRARAARPPRGPRPTARRGRRSGSARSGGGAGRSPGRARGPRPVKASDLSDSRST